VPCSPDWLPDEACLDDEYPGDLEEYEDPDNAPPPGLDDDQLTVLIARLPRHRPHPGRPSLHCAITGLPGRRALSGHPDTVPRR
jgi:hypothetical protein